MQFLCTPKGQVLNRTYSFRRGVPFSHLTFPACLWHAFTRIAHVVADVVAVVSVEDVVVVEEENAIDTFSNRHLMESCKIIQTSKQLTPLSAATTPRKCFSFDLILLLKENLYKEVDLFFHNGFLLLRSLVYASNLCLKCRH